MPAMQKALDAPGSTDPVVINLRRHPQVGILVNVPNGVTFAGQVEVAGLQSGPWNTHETMGALTASANGNLEYPVGCVRLTATALTGGTVTLTVVQAEQD